MSRQTTALFALTGWPEDEADYFRRCTDAGVKLNKDGSPRSDGGSAAWWSVRDDWQSVGCPARPASQPLSRARAREGEK